MNAPSDPLAFPKMARLNRGMVITEKLDGTNAQIFIVNSDTDPTCSDFSRILGTVAGVSILAGSRTRWLSPGREDNYGFAQWVKENLADLALLGPGCHFGEWWGRGIQRTYGLTERRFSLFNAGRWAQVSSGVVDLSGEGPVAGPRCCSVVPKLWEGDFNSTVIDEVVNNLRANGSVAVPGFMDAEGVVVYHTAAKQSFKVTLKRDKSPKSLLTPVETGV